MIKNDTIADAHSRYAKEIGKTVVQLTVQEKQTAFVRFSTISKDLLEYKEYEDKFSRLLSKH